MHEDDQTLGVFHERIIVHKDAHKTDVKQTNSIALWDVAGKAAGRAVHELVAPCAIHSILRFAIFLRPRP